MADKEATVYIVDVGRSMGRKHQGRKETDFDWAMRYVWDKITTMVRDHGFKMWNMDDPSPGGHRTKDVADRSPGPQNRWYVRWSSSCSRTNKPGTENELAEDESYAHITLFQPISQCAAYQWNRFMDN